jgi:hypothetical protein
VSATRALLPGLAGAAVAAVGAAAWPYTVDDAYVLARYARRLAAGLGYTMNDGPPTDGVTGPLALVPALAGELAFGDPVFASKAFGLASAALAAALSVRAAARESSRHGAVALAFVVASPLLGVWAVGGLGTGLATLALTVAALATLAPDTAPKTAPDPDPDPAMAPAPDPVPDPVPVPVPVPVPETAPDPDARRGTWRPWATGLGVAALAWLRPELAPASLVLLALTARRARRPAIVAGALALAGAASVVAFRLALFGTPLPLSAQAKPPDLAHGAEYVARALVVVLGVAGVIPVALAAREEPRRRRGLALLLGVHLAAVLLAGGDWMPGFRLLVPILPLYAFVAAGPVARRLRCAGAKGGAPWRGLALLALPLAVPLAAGAFTVPQVRASGRARETAAARLADRLAARSSPVALLDVGYLAYRSGVEVVDLGGITDPAIGTLPGGHADKRIDPGLLRARDPRALVLHSTRPPRIEGGRLRALWGHPVERRVARMPWVQAHFRVAQVVTYAPGYHYVVLVRHPPRAPSDRPTAPRSSSRARDPR